MSNSADGSEREENTIIASFWSYPTYEALPTFSISLLYLQKIITLQSAPIQSIPHFFVNYLSDIDYLVMIKYIWQEFATEYPRR